MNLLPTDLKNKILSYLPIFDEDRSKLNNQIRTSQKIKNIIIVYKTYWNSITSDMNYANWLNNDISRWLNDDEATMYRINSKYKKYASKVFNVHESDVNTWEKIDSYERELNPLKMSKIYLHSFKNDDLSNCILFLEKCVKE